MKVRYLATLGFVFAVCFLVLSSGQRTELSNKYDTWLSKEVVYIISPKEKEVFGKLETDRDRDLFIEEFWKQRDPTPGTPQNEFRDEHYRRIDYVNKRFGGGAAAPGWTTDRGRTFIILGPPLNVDRYASADICPVEIWYYLRSLRSDRSSFFRLLFFEEFGAGEFKLYSPATDGPKRLVPFPERWRTAKNIISERAAGVKGALPPSWTPADGRAYDILIEYVTAELAEASISSFPGFSDAGQAERSDALLKEIPSSPQSRVLEGYAVDFLARKAPVEVSYSVHPVTGRSEVKVFQDPSDRFLVNYVIAPEVLSIDFFRDRYFAGLKTDIRVTDTGGKTGFEAGKFYPIELTGQELKAVAESSFEFYGAFPINPGTYLVSLRLENTVSKEFTSTETKIAIPEGRRLQLSPLIVARNVVKDPSKNGGRAFQLGEFQIYPSVGHVFLEKDRLSIFFQVYGLNTEMTESTGLEYSLLSEGKPLRTWRRDVRNSKSQPGYLEEFSLEDLTPGIYTIKVALRDREGKELLSEKEEFIISEKPVRKSWVYAESF